MSFANPLPWWAIALVVFGAAFVAWFAYSRSSIARERRFALMALRFVTLLALVLFLLRPVSSSPEADTSNAIVPVLVDTSRSMSIEDPAMGGRRIDWARRIVTERIGPTLGSRFQIEMLGFGEGISPIDPAKMSAAARRSDLEQALGAVRERYRGKVVAGIVLLSDGGDTNGGAEGVAANSAPIFPVAVEGAGAWTDREVLSLTGADQVLDDSRVELAVSAVSHGLGTAPFELRLRENGRPIDVKRVVPSADGTPVRQVFQVSSPQTPSVYTVEIPAASGELVPENNARSVLVQPPVRPRRVLLVEGAPGFEHSFLKRAWLSDSGLEIDSVVKKGRNEQGGDTFYIQAARSRAESLTSGYPADRRTLFFYDAVVLANVEGSQFTRAHLENTRAFVAERGGGLLVLGARSFLRQGLAGTPLEEALPLDPAERAGDAVPASALGSTASVALTPAGEAHPIMQLAPDADETRRRWHALPSLAAVASIGGARPGASVLATTTGAGGVARPLVAVQRFGEGRALLFAGEASWRWRMLMPAADRTFDTFWKQSLRWLALGATDPVNVTASPNASSGDMLPLHVVVRNAAFEPQANATVAVRVTMPDGRVESLKATADATAGQDSPGRYVAAFRPPAAGIYKLVADAAAANGAAIGSSSMSLLVGGSDIEMTDPRVNRRLLQRMADASGGRLVRDDEVSALGDMLKASVPAAALAVRRDLWHTGWSFAAIVMLLGAEWILRRRWGMR